ncbi:uncharacterized protein KZ484_020369 isoform 4-T4 [Pholidichthys leucotaenia]
MCPEDELQRPPLGFSPTQEGADLTVSYGDLDNSLRSGRRNRASSTPKRKTLESRIRWSLQHPSFHFLCRDFANEKSTFLKILKDAEAAANSAAIQLVSFKDALEDEIADSRQSAKDKPRIARQRGLLLEKLEDFRRINKSLRQKLKQLQDAEADRTAAHQQIEVLLKTIAQAESENEHLKKDLNESERRVQELTDLRREEQENTKSAVDRKKSVEATHARLQAQLRSKEAENNRLTVQLRDAQLAKAHLEKDSKRRQKEQMTVEKEKRIAHLDTLKSQVADMTVKLQKEKDELTAANEIVMQQVEKLSVDNEELSISNAALKASIARLEQHLADCESALIEEKIVSQEKKHQAEQYQYQVAELRAEIDDVRIKYADLLRETEKMQDGKETQVEKVRQELQGRAETLKLYHELLSATEQNLSGCQENLQRSQRKCSEKSESIRQLQVKMDSQTNLLKSSLEMKESIREANLHLREKVDSLQKDMDKQQQDNFELIQRLAAQEEALSSSNRQLDQRSSDCQALSRQLEAALADVRQQVEKVKEQAISREAALQTKILELEAEKRRRDDELRLLRQSKLSVEKQFEVRLKDLQLSLDQSESRKQSIQNYVDFLKNSYRMMFDEGLQTSTFGASYFLK